jgi:hypothetical protein
MSRFGRTWCQAAILALLPIFAAAQDRGASSDEAWRPWAQQLAALKPTDAEAYIYLAEELLDASLSMDTRSANELQQLARHLFGLAGALDPAGTGRSACLALADFTSDPRERERFLALAGLLPGRDVLATWTQQKERTTVSPTEALVFSEALGYFRNGQGNRALSLLQRETSVAALESLGHLLPGGAERFLEDCRHYTNGRKPTLFEAGVARMLVLEAALLAGTERSWSGEVLLSAASPLVEIDPDRLDEMLGVDAARPYFVDGTFVRTPNRQANSDAAN